VNGDPLGTVFSNSSSWKVVPGNDAHPAIIMGKAMLARNLENFMLFLLRGVLAGDLSA
jgi:hypothetical protein